MSKHKSPSPSDIFTWVQMKWQFILWRLTVIHRYNLSPGIKRCCIQMAQIHCVSDVHYITKNLRKKKVYKQNSEHSIGAKYMDQPYAHKLTHQCESCVCVLTETDLFRHRQNAFLRWWLFGLRIDENHQKSSNRFSCNDVMLFAIDAHCCWSTVWSNNNKWEQKRGEKNRLMHTHNDIYTDIDTEWKTKKTK